MNPFESEISSVLLKAAGFRPSGRIDCDLEESYVAHRGSLEGGFPRKKTLDSSDFPPRLNDLLGDTYEWSKTDPRGPVYHCTIEVRPNREVVFTYCWQKGAAGDLGRIARTLSGGIPSFVMRERFDPELVDALEDYDIGSALLEYVPAQAAAGRTIPAGLLELYAVVDWQSDTNNGALEQYFSRKADVCGVYPRAEMYGKTLRGLETLGLAAAADLFREAVALYAHFHEEVDAARESLGIEAVPPQEESDIMSRYFDMEPELDQAIASYVRANLPRLVQG